MKGNASLATTNVNIWCWIRVNPSNLVSKSHEVSSSGNSSSEINLSRPFAGCGECAVERVVVAGNKPEAPTTTPCARENRGAEQDCRSQAFRIMSENTPGGTLCIAPGVAPPLTRTVVVAWNAPAEISLCELQMIQGSLSDTMFPYDGVALGCALHLSRHPFSFPFLAIQHYV